MNRNWREKYHRDNEPQQDNQETPEPSESDSDDYQQPGDTSQLSQNLHSRCRFSIWLSAVCYSFALLVLVATFIDWSTTAPDSDQPNADPATFSAADDEAYTEFEVDELSQLNLDETLQQIVDNPTREAVFRERLNSLYLVILGAVAGYLHAIHRASSH
jgi:hypothetical protein